MIAAAVATTVAAASMTPTSTHAQLLPSATTQRATSEPVSPTVAQPAPLVQPPISPVAPELKGRNVDDIKIAGNTLVSTPVILNLIRTRKNEPFDPATVEEDYRRVYDLRKFSNVEARVEPTATGGVVVSFTVSEQRQIVGISFTGLPASSKDKEEAGLRELIAVQVGEAIDPFRVNLARDSIENYYREKNYPFAHVEVDPALMADRGEVVFNVVKGPNVKVRQVRFIGNHSISNERLKAQVRTSSWVFVFSPGTFRPEVIEQDVGAIRKYYEGKGFFDVKVGRKLVFSADNQSLLVEFVIEEGARYKVDRVSFRGNVTCDEQTLRQNLKLTEGLTFDQELLQRDVRQIVRTYSPYGLIYDPENKSPDYLHIEPRQVFRREAGKVELVYEISEGNKFKLGNVKVKGNWKSQDKVVLRELRVQPGQTYNSGEIADAADRLRGTPFFQSVSVTPIGDEPGVRDLLVEVSEGRTASFSIGAGINSNGGVGANLSYEQKNFDLGNPPDAFLDILSDRAFTGAGQNFRVSLEPGTRQNNASVRFSEPYLFDQPYSFSGEAYLRTRKWADWADNRVGGRVAFGKRFNYIYSASVSLRGEQVEITRINELINRSPEIVEAEGFSALTSAGIQLRRDTTNRGPLQYRGSIVTGNVEFVGALGGDYTFTKLTAGWDRFIELGQDLRDRRVVLALRADTGYIFDDAPFFERFYGGGLGSVRGFDFRGISPRSGLEDDAIGGDFMTTASAEMSFPLAGEFLRGVVFTDAGTVETKVDLGTIRSSVGFGFRLKLPVFGQAPLAIDFALPLTKDDRDETQIVSFSLGIMQ